MIAQTISDIRKMENNLPIKKRHTARKKSLCNFPGRWSMWKELWRYQTPFLCRNILC